jgi:hypothetical protein
LEKERKIKETIDRLEAGKRDVVSLMKEGDILRRNLKEFNKLIEDKLEKK